MSMMGDHRFRQRQVEGYALRIKELGPGPAKLWAVKHFGPTLEERIRMAAVAKYLEIK